MKYLTSSQRARQNFFLLSLTGSTLLLAGCVSSKPDQHITDPRPQCQPNIISFSPNPAPASSTTYCTLSIPVAANGTCQYDLTKVDMNNSISLPPNPVVIPYGSLQTVFPIAISNNVKATPSVPVTAICESDHTMTITGRLNLVSQASGGPPAIVVNGNQAPIARKPTFKFSLQVMIPQPDPDGKDTTVYLEYSPDITKVKQNDDLENANSKLDLPDKILIRGNGDNNKVGHVTGEVELLAGKKPVDSKVLIYAKSSPDAKDKSDPVEIDLVPDTP